MNKEFLIRLALIFGFTAAVNEQENTASFSKDGKNLSLPEFEEHIRNANTASNTVESLRATVLEKDTEISTLKTEVADLKAKSGSVEALTAKIDEVKASYIKLKGDTKDDNFIASLATMDFAALKVLEKEYTEALETKFPNSCQKCGSTEIARNSVQVGEDGKPIKETKALSDAEVMATLRNTKPNVSSIHEEVKK